MNRHVRIVRARARRLAGVDRDARIGDDRAAGCASTGFKSISFTQGSMQTMRETPTKTAASASRSAGGTLR